MFDSLLWELIIVVVFVTDMLWVISALARTYVWNVKIINWCYFELKPFFLPAVMVEIVDTAVHRVPDVWDCFFFATSIYIWFAYKDKDKDDRWKKRRTKVLDKITQRGAKLVVVPTQ